MSFGVPAFIHARHMYAFSVPNFSSVPGLNFDMC